MRYRLNAALLWLAIRLVAACRWQSKTRQSIHRDLLDGLRDELRLSLACAKHPWARAADVGPTRKSVS